MSKYVDDEKYLSYFKDELEKLSKEYEKSEQYTKIIDDQITTLSQVQGLRGTQKYLVDNIENAIELQKQKQDTLKNIISLKKIIVDYVVKEESAKSSEAGSEATILDNINKLISEAKKDVSDIGNIKISIDQDSLLDDEIDKQLNQ